MGVYKSNSWLISPILLQNHDLYRKELQSIKFNDVEINKYMTMSKHFEYLVGDKKNEFTLKVREGDKVEKIDSVKILFMDERGITVEEVKHLGKNRRIFVPHYSLISLRSELI